MKNKEKIWNSRFLSIATFLSYIVASLVMTFSLRYMSRCIDYETEAENNRYELQELGYMLADASDYLTNEAREFAVTGELTHLYNYWHEVQVVKRRDQAVDALKSYDPPEDEVVLLNEAKAFSDRLIETETYSMKLVLMSQQNRSERVNAETKAYVEEVKKAELPPQYRNLSREEMQQKAIQILFDYDYSKSKEEIMSPIDQFQNRMNKRLNQEVVASVNGRRNAWIILVTCMVIALCIIGMVIFELYSFYVAPLRDYTEQLQSLGYANDNMAIASVRIQPKGAYELQEFGRIFNGLAHLLSQEVEKMAEEEKRMRIAKEEAVAANRAKSDFLAAMSHELRTPLNAITGYVYLLEQCELSEEQKRYCHNIHVSSETLLNLISDILDFSKIENGSMELEEVAFSLPRLLDEVYQVMENSARQKQLKFSMDIRGDIPIAVVGDPAKLRQILLNLIGNAIKFTDTGYVTMKVDMLSKEKEHCEICFQVEDSGIGIAREKLTDIFQPFVQSDAGTTRQYGGTGLGLSISKRLVEQYSTGKHTIEVESEIGKGSVFSFVIPFPIADEKDCVPIMNLQENTRPIDGEYVILLVDDNQMNLTVETEIMESFGVSVDAVTSGAECIHMVEEKRYDLILLDIHMPKMDGYETAKALRTLETGKEVPIIALTADAVEGVRNKVLYAGMNDYATKPLKPESLKVLLRRYLQISGLQREKQGQPVPFRNEYFDVEECLTNLNRNERVFFRLIEQFRNRQRHTEEYISRHIQENHVENALYMLHDLKGVAGNLCLYPLYGECVQLETALRTGKPVDAERFQICFQRTMQEVEEQYQKRLPYYQENDETESYDRLYKRFVYLCGEYDIAAVDLFERNRKTFRNHMGKKDYMLLQDAVLKYDFETVLEMI